MYVYVCVYLCLCISDIYIYTNITLYLSFGVLGDKVLETFNFPAKLDVCNLLLSPVKYLYLAKKVKNK